jgi:FecR protein
MMKQHCLQLLTAALLAATGVQAAHAAEAGTVTFATGSVSAERQPAAPLAKGDAVLAEDNVITGAASRAQLMMIDGARIAIRPSSRIRIDEYVYAAAAQPAAPAVTGSAQDSSVISLVKGGFRTITGAIGKEDPSNYEVRTAVGVLGIRGTNFAVLLCSGNCNAAPGVPPGSVVPDGLYIMVSEGRIVFSNEVANLEAGAGEFLFVPLDTRRPLRLETTPPVFIDDSDLRFEPPGAAGAAAGGLTGFDAKLGTRRAPDSSASGSSAPGTGEEQKDDAGQTETPRQSIQGIDSDGSPVDLTPGGAPDPQNRTIGYATGPLGPVGTIVSGVLDNAPTQYSVDGNNNLTGFGNLYPARTGVDIADFDIGSAANADTGFDAMTVLRWGRWAGGTAAITLSDGSDASQDLGNQSIHWVSSPAWATPPVMPVTGSASYSLIGSTSPTDNFGNTGVLGAATFQADFTNLRVDSTLAIDINGSSWSASGQGNIGAAAQLPAHLFQGIYGAVAIDGISGGSGTFSGFFSEPGPASDPNFPGGVGLTFSLQDMGGTTTVSGAAAFGNP